MRASRSRPERQHPDREVGDARVAEAARADRRPPPRRPPRGGRRRRSRRRARAAAGSSASTRRARARWFAHAARRVDLVVAAQRDRDAGDDPRRGPARRRRGARDAREHVLADGALVGHPEDRPDASSPATRSITGASAARRIGVGTMSVTSSGLCTRKSSFSTSTGPGPGERGVQDLEVVAHEAGRPLVREAEHVGDDPVVRRTEAEREPAFAHRLVRERLLRHRDRVAGLDRHRPRCRARSATSPGPSA